jgi:hypothetical protein
LWGHYVGQPENTCVDKYEVVAGDLLSAGALFPLPVCMGMHKTQVILSCAIMELHSPVAYPVHSTVQYSSETTLCNKWFSILKIDFKMLSYCC